MPRCRSATRATFSVRSIRWTGSSRRTSSARRTSRTHARAWWAGCTRSPAPGAERCEAIAVIAGLDPAIHRSSSKDLLRKGWMRGSSPRMTGGKSGTMLLSDVLVIDATERLGWVAGRVLADLGADVVKLEPPGTDRTRLEDLLRAADICLLTPSDSGARLDPRALRENYPRLVVVAIRPFGGVGPRSAWKASDIELMAAGGAMALAGEPDGMPMRVSEPQSYGWAGAQAAIGALVALFHRDATGRGDLVDVSAQASVVTALSHAPAFVDLVGLEPTRAGAFMTGRSVKGARYRVFWPCC